MFFKILKWTLATLLLIALTVVVACFVASKKLPNGQSGDAAQRLANKMETAVNLDAWKTVKAIRWVFRGDNRHIWDRERGLSYVSFGEGKKKTDIYFYIASKKGIALRGGERVSEEEEKELLQEGYAHWANDSYWLNPIAKIRDKGVTLEIDEKNPEALLVHFSSGGVTPGDSYRYMIGDDGKPLYWQMWVKILPIKGARASFDEWIQLPEGAWLSTNHRLVLGFEVELSEIQSSTNVKELNNGVDPFETLLSQMN